MRPAGKTVDQEDVFVAWHRSTSQNLLIHRKRVAAEMFQHNFLGKRKKSDLSPKKKERIF
ncbi:hypothetical protein BSNK01_14560 [Bacillaceae bacterium]